MKRVIELATQYDRYGYCRIKALLNQEGCQVNSKRVERIWRRENLKVPHRQPKRHHPTAGPENISPVVVLY